MPFKDKAEAKKNQTRYTWRWKLRTMYGITPEDYWRLYMEQNGVCAICRNPEPVEDPLRPGEPKLLCVDHEHEVGKNVPGKIRGLLCSGCNWGLGQFKDDPLLLRSGADYLEKHRG